MFRLEDIDLLLPFRPVSARRSMPQTYSTFKVHSGYTGKYASISQSQYCVRGTVARRLRCHYLVEQADAPSSRFGECSSVSDKREHPRG